ncbi:adenosylcobinamide-GDP ribazoletransferase [Elizabethkingia sp. JS20170427COW]|uniref:adenosylcobinamide-GDP ribazoletransferase n=1 Tax=Elizabethkingia sp. JS20170427COW TaxID=2583851 RepID=UPI00111050F0|nr:adenosylcobinamide-GDP ribazoletransferase [Elizabethkingia sp. JS20170427COW]QCX54222.1 adenosylcobinamide-GDP ribazoletransferase [Elizabethkingia sp. JS20170427COW]
MKNEFRIFLTTLIFFTRIPIKIKNFQSSDLNKCTRYFPLVGILVGSASFLVLQIALYLFPVEISVILSLIIGILITGSFHEDGFGDVFDGFGGGWNKTRILEIMKDSRLGTYGTVALLALFLLKVYALSFLVNFYAGNCYLLLLLFIVYHALARTTGITLSFLLPYSREDASSKSKPLAQSFTWKEVLGAFAFGGIPFLLLLKFSLYYLITLPILALLVLYSRYYFKRWIDGYTGDCLGAVEQFAEIIILLTFVALCRFI